MSGTRQDILEILGQALGGRPELTDYEVDVLPLPAVSGQTDRLVRLKTLDEALQDFDSEVGYLVQLKIRKTPPPAPDPETPALKAPKNGQEAIYQTDGKLNLPYLLRNAELLLASGDTGLARNVFKAIHRSGERTALALDGIARCYEVEGKFEEARIHYEDSIAYQPDPAVYQRLASVLLRLKKEQGAAEVMERALNLRDLPTPARFELHKACGNCWTRLERHPDAERHYLRALEIDPNADEIRANLGALYLQSGRLPEAKRHFQDAIASNDRNARALTGLGSCLLNEGDKRGAHDAFARALDTELNNPTAVFYLVKCAYELKFYPTATRILEEYVQAAPVNTNLLYSLAGLQFHLGRIPDARSTAQRILELAPQHAGATELLGMMEQSGSQ
ncbi:MAG: tetratricopeptide repeat protein [Oligoflexia bacterium]|nr:tetratricopeptide repeat protein [Oligoflexia bacterium]